MDQPKQHRYYCLPKRNKMERCAGAVFNKKRNSNSENTDERSRFKSSHE
jgi:hypothetical protein